ncbi:uncharacterized protein LOC142344374 isoform X3 [Convolutriloba macropyga]
MPQQARDGDWTCTEENCSASNFARRTECFKCGKGRDFKAWKKQKAKEIGGSEAKKSGGLFSADDWRCNKCGNINWARRNTCNMCNAPKVEEDERTGYGGGFNDRQDIEYVDRDSSGDEIDDFGRKKKKLRAALNVTDQSSSGGMKEKSDMNGEDDDEDDDDEGDASKYNLDSDSEEKKEKRKSRSRSSSSSSSSSRSSKSSSSSSSSRSRSRSNRKRKRSKSSSKSRSKKSSRSRSKKSRSKSRKAKSRSRSRSSRSRSKSNSMKKRSNGKSSGKDRKRDSRSR